MTWQSTDRRFRGRSTPVSAHDRRDARSRGNLDAMQDQRTLGPPRAQARAVNFVRRFGPSLGRNVHILALFVDGACVTTGIAVLQRSHPATPLTPEDVGRVQRVLDPALAIRSE